MEMTIQSENQTWKVMADGFVWLFTERNARIFAREVAECETDQDVLDALVALSFDSYEVKESEVA